jgi:hypothetical protein
MNEVKVGVMRMDDSDSRNFSVALRTLHRNLTSLICKEMRNLFGRLWLGIEEVVDQ